MRRPPFHLAFALALATAGCDRRGSVETGVCYDTWEEVHWEWREAGCAYRARCDDTLQISPEEFYTTCTSTSRTRYRHVGFLIEGCIDGCRALDCVRALQESDCQYPNTVQECLDAIGWLEALAPPESDRRTCRRPVSK